LLEKKSILVTGGAGFIGSHLVDSLLVRENSVTIIDNLSSAVDNYYKNYLNKKNVKFIKGDIRNLDMLINNSKNVDVIFHFAADPRVDLSAKNPIDNFNINVSGTLNLLEAARKNNITEIFFASSGGTLYGETENIPTPEENQLNPISCYGASKASCEMYLRAYASSYGFNIISYRLANIFGPRSNHGVMYDFYNKLKKNPRELLILGNGQQKKSYLYINDCIDAIIFLEKINSKGFQAFNIGSDEWVTVNQIAEYIIEELELKNVKFKYSGGIRGWVGDIPKMKLDITKIKNLGWKPKTKFKDGLKLYIEYLKSHL
jgi:UDP-glucose 4-epimerase